MAFRRSRAAGCAILVVLLAASCVDRHPIAPTAPALPLAPVDPQGGMWSVSGRVWLHTTAGVSPAAGGNVFGWIETPRSGVTTGRVAIDADGRYRFRVPQDTTRVRLQADGDAYQPCAATASTSGDVTIDVDLVSDRSLLGGHLPAQLASRAPVLSGVVYEQTSAGRRPVPNAWVSLDGLYGLGLLIADTLTDADGRYVLCDVPQLPGLDLFVLAGGFGLFESGDVVLGKEMFDVELRPLAAHAR